MPRQPRERVFTLSLVETWLNVNDEKDDDDDERRETLTVVGVAVAASTVPTHVSTPDR